MRTRQSSDAGQAFPIYIVMVAGLLFLAFAFFAVGKASVTRNGAQGAADAAALAAAQEARDQIGPEFLGALLVPGGLGDFLADHDITADGSCNEAERFAAENRADLGSCVWTPGYHQDKFTVTVKTRYTVGDTVIPGTETRHATARATALVEFQCDWKPSENPSKDKGDKEETPGSFTFDCDGWDRFEIDPLRPDPWGELSKALFAVHLIDN